MPIERDFNWIVEILFKKLHKTGKNKVLLKIRGKIRKSSETLYFIKNKSFIIVKNIIFVKV